MGTPQKWSSCPGHHCFFNLHPLKCKGEYPIEEDEETSSRLDGGPIPSLVRISSKAVVDCEEKVII